MERCKYWRICDKFSLDNWCCKDALVANTMCSTKIKLDSEEATKTKKQSNLTDF